MAGGGALGGVRLLSLPIEPHERITSRSCTASQGEAGEEEPPDAGIVGADPYNIIYSSGTTGEPKGIVHTHEVRAGYCTLFASAFRMSPESVCLHAESIVFNGAFLDLMPWMYLGCTYILHPAFDADRVIAEIERSRVTHMVMVPSCNSPPGLTALRHFTRTYLECTRS
jgi:acyl-coenzyme A synthetase/AMP-(fatty) acid ligase